MSTPETPSTPDQDPLRRLAVPIDLDAASLDPIMQAIGDAPLVLLGEATHGTEEFYRARELLTLRLLEERGFDAVAVEADWPDADRVNRYVRGRGDDASAPAALGDFQRFPQWMWRNTRVVHLVDRLAALNTTRRPEAGVGFYGLDMYSLYRSIEAVLAYLDAVDPEAADKARLRYACFDHSLEEPQRFGYQASMGLRPDCEREAVGQLMELQREASRYLARDGRVASDEHFFAERNAAVVADAERYYRAMFADRSNTWNLRDRHMFETLEALREHLQSQGRPGRIVVWEHNSHLGDARATSMGQRGDWNVGQLAREAHGDDAFVLGFTTFDGTVAAASDWDAPVQRMPVKPAVDDSIETRLRSLDMGGLFLDTRVAAARQALRERRWERAIGVIYRPQTEMQSHYFRAAVAEQFDGVVHFDTTEALDPLDKTPRWDDQRVPETFPFGV